MIGRLRPNEVVYLNLFMLITFTDQVIKYYVAPATPILIGF